MTVGDEVVRISGAPHQVGARGRIVEVAMDRARVYWHTTNRPSIKPKRTWVSFKILRRAE